MNPGKVIDAFPLDTNIRYGPRYRTSTLLPTGFSFAQDGGSLQRAAERCVGVGRCRSETIAVMCPSYRVTHDEKHSTRGRAKLLGELFQGETTPESWRNEEVFEALDLCLSCKGCAVDCPTQVDMATYKSEFLFHYYAKRLRPRSAYALGLIPWSGRIASRVPRTANGLLRNRFTGALLKRLAGISQRREVPVFAEKSFRHGAVATRLRDEKNPSVVLWPDTFTDIYLPARARHLDYRVTVCDARTVFATAGRFPDADEVVADWPDRYFSSLAKPLGPRDVICVLSHDRKFDLLALAAAVSTSAGYIGAMGSRRTQAERRARLRAEGITDEQLARIMGPIGIDIGARSPKETAIAIIAEIIARHAGRPVPSLRDGRGPIHGPS